MWARLQTTVWRYTHLCCHDPLGGGPGASTFFMSDARCCINRACSASATVILGLYTVFLQQCLQVRAVHVYVSCQFGHLAGRML